MNESNQFLCFKSTHKTFQHNQPRQCFNLTVYYDFVKNLFCIILYMKNGIQALYFFLKIILDLSKQAKKEC